MRTSDLEVAKAVLEVSGAVPEAAGVYSEADLEVAGVHSRPGPCDRKPGGSLKIIVYTLQRQLMPCLLSESASV